MGGESGNEEWMASSLTHTLPLLTHTLTPPSPLFLFFFVYPLFLHFMFFLFSRPLLLPLFLPLYLPLFLPLFLPLSLPPSPSLPPTCTASAAALLATSEARALAIEAWKLFLLPLSTSHAPQYMQSRDASIPMAMSASTKETPWF